MFFWIAHCISLVWFFVLVNGFPHASLAALVTRGKGSLCLFCYLFVIVIEVLGRMISAAISGDLLSSTSLGTGIDISHLLFVDDTLLFYRFDSNHLCNLRSLFFLFKKCWFEDELSQVKIGFCGIC